MVGLETGFAVGFWVGFWVIFVVGLTVGLTDGFGVLAALAKQTITRNIIMVPKLEILIFLARNRVL